MHHAESTGIGKLTYVRWQTPQARTSRHNSDTVKHSHLQACPRRSPLTSHLGLPLCTHSWQPCYAGSKHHAPPPALAHLLQWCHLATCQVVLKARALLPHNRPTVRPSMANCRAGLNKALKFAPHTAPHTTTNQHNQAIHEGNTQMLRQKALSLQRYPTTASSQTLNTYTTASSELLSTTAAIKNHTGYVQWCSVHHAASTGIGKLTYVRWQTPQARTSRHNSDTVKHSHLQACPRRSPQPSNPRGQHTSAPSEKHCHYRGILRRLRHKR